MDNSISSRSLMIGNVSTEESRNEIRKSPGAPSPPANATIFCFHPFRLVAKRNSSNPCAATCLEMAWVQMSDTRGKLLRESRAIEMIHEDLHKRRAVEIRQLGNFSDDPHVAEPFDGFAVLPVLIANQHYAMHRQFRSMQRGQRQQRVIHRAQSAARREKQCREDRFAYSGIRARDEKMMPHARPTIARAAARLETGTLAGFPSWRKLLLAAAIRAAPDNCSLRMDPRLYRVIWPSNESGMLPSLCIRVSPQYLTRYGVVAFSFRAAGLTCPA